MEINDQCSLMFDQGRLDGMAAKADEFCEKIRLEGMGDEVPVWNHAVGFHKDNRGGVGVEPTDVWRLLAKHAPRGWSWLQVRKLARAAEIPPGAEGDAHRAKNAELAAKSGGMLWSGRTTCR